MKIKDLWVIGIILITVGLLSSCEMWEKEMGEDLLPPGDNVYLLFDTIFDIHAYPVTGKPPITSERTYLSTTLYLLGNTYDSLVGSSEASLVTQFNTTSTFVNAPDTHIDSMILHLIIDDYIGNTDRQMEISVYEMKERIYMDSVYYSDYNMTDRYEPDKPLAVQRIFPEQGDTVEILFDTTSVAFLELRDKFYEVQTDTALFRSDSLFKDFFNGFYITATSLTDEGAIAKVGLSNVVSRLTMRYHNDSTEIDSTEQMDYTWATFSIDEYYAQKINIFKHAVDPESYLYSVIDQESLRPEFCFVQGMAGVNTRLSFENLENWIGEEKVAINSATLIFDAVPPLRSGIEVEELAYHLMIYTELDDGHLEVPYDYRALASTDEDLFGGIVKPEATSMFDTDTLYTYRFNMGLHFQSMIDGSNSDTTFRLRPFRLQVYDATINPDFSMLWGNPDVDNSRIRLEVVYLKL